MVLASRKPGPLEEDGTAYAAPGSSNVTGRSNAMNCSDPPPVAILLSTFNGERFLDEQLLGYLEQSHPNWMLYWRDDGSCDRTVTLMTAFAQEGGRDRCYRVGGERRLGAAGSFFTLLREAIAGPADFFAFSDQDDVWLPDKIADGIATLTNLPPDRPALYYCARTLVDSTCRQIGEVAPLCHPPGFPAALTQNVIPGCCMLLNRKAAALIAMSEPPEGTWHDWWSYLIVAANQHCWRQC